MGIENLGLYNITIDFKKVNTYVTTNIYYKENDTNTAKVRARLVNDEVPIDLANTMASVKTITPLETTVTFEATIIDAVDGIIEYTFPVNALIEGVNFFEVILSESGMIKTSPRMAYKVLDSIEDTGIEVETNYPILLTLISDVQSALDSEIIRVANEVIRVANENTRITKETDRATAETTRQTQESTRQTAMADMQTIFNGFAPEEATNVEVQGARVDITGKEHASLQARLLSDNKGANTLYASVNGTYITSDSVDGYAKNVIIEGNTVQSATVLSDIKSTGTKLSDGRYEIPLLCTGKNLFSGEFTSPQHIRIDAGYEGEFSISTLTRTTKRIPCKPNTKYIITGGDRCAWRFEDYYRNKVGWANTSSITTPSNCRYLYVYYSSTGTHTNVQIEEGLVSTTIEPYQSHKLTILSNEPIEKVGTIADRIVQLSDGIWYKEKNNITYVVNGSESSLALDDTTKTNTIAFRLTMSDKKVASALNLNILSDKLKTIGQDFRNNDEELVNNDGWNTNIFFRILKSKLATQDLSGIKTFLQSNNILIKYPLATPVYIPLPDDQQIALRTFNNKTNILSLCEIEPTIKADVPKSTQASINSINTHLDTVDSELEKIKKLEDATNSTVIDDGKGFVNISDTSNGYLSDVKLEGRTLNQLVTNGNFANGTTNWTFDGATGSVVNNALNVALNGSNSSGAVQQTTNSTISAGKKYFLRANVRVTNANSTLLRLYAFGGTTVGTVQNAKTVSNPVQNQWYEVSGIVTIPSDSVGNLTIKLSHLYIDSTVANGKVMEVQNVMALDLTALGMTNYSADEINGMLNGYIEGLKSVGQDATKIVVSSVKADGNLFDGKYEIGTIDASGLDNNSETARIRTSYIRIKKGMPVNFYFEYISSITAYGWEYDINKKPIKAINITSNKMSYIPSANCEYIRFRTEKDSFNHMLSYSTISYRPIETDKKEILYLDTVDSTWKKPVFRGLWSNGIMTVGDVAEKKSDGKYSYRKRMLEKVINGSETGWAINATYANTIRFVCSDILTSNNFTTTATPITALSDKFEILSASNSSVMDKDGISQHSAQLTCINISKSKLATQDVAGFKTWLASNPITVVYQLLQDQVYECTPIDVASYDSETNYTLECGVLSPRSTIKCQNYIGSIVNNLKEQVSVLQNKVYKENITMMTMLLNHEARLIAHSI